MHWLRRAEWTAWALAVVLASVWAGARGVAWLSSERSLRAFEAQRHAVEQAAVGPTAVESAVTRSPTGVDQSLWDRGRIRAYAAALARPGPPPLAVLRIPRLRLEVPVLAGTDDWTLNRAVGHIEGTALPGEQGNVGIAGHRDGFFRVLKDIAAGDVLELALPTGTQRYRVQQLSVVRPDDVSVLEPGPSEALTLVTCHPFYFVGSAPERFIVRSERIP